MDFKQATERLKDAATDQDVADALNVSVQSVRQARSKRESLGHRKPPDGWRKALIQLAQKRREELRDLEAALQADTEDSG